MKERLWYQQESIKDTIDASLKEFIESELQWLKRKETKLSEDNEREMFSELVDLFLERIKDKSLSLDQREKNISLYEEMFDEISKEKEVLHEKDSQIEKELQGLSWKVIDTIVSEWRTRYITLLEDAAQISKKNSEEYVKGPLLDKTQDLFWDFIGKIRKKDQIT